MTTTIHSEHNAVRGHNAGHIDEARAVQVALSGSRAERAWVATQSLVKLMRNTHDTTQVFIAGIVLNGPKIGPLLDRFYREGGQALFDARATLDSGSVDYAKLRQLGPSTLGGAYARYLGDNGLDPDLFKPPPGLPPELSYLAQRIRQTHDIWHVLTGYRPNVPGELALQGFTYAQLGLPSARIIATVGTVFRSPMTAPAVFDGYRRGKGARFLAVVRFEDRWEQSLDAVRLELGILPARVQLNS